MKKEIVALVFLLATSSLFAQNCPNGKRTYNDFPQEEGVEQQWLEPYDQKYLPYGICGDPRSVKVKKIEEKVDCFWDEANGAWETLSQDHGFCLFSVLKITYDVTCVNKLRYRGVKYITSNDECLKSGWLHGVFTTEENEFIANAHDWQDMSLDSLKFDGSVKNFVTSFKTWKYDEKFDKNDINQKWKD
jgi:hypothetical protein